MSSNDDERRDIDKLTIVYLLVSSHSEAVGGCSNLGRQLAHVGSGYVEGESGWGG